MGCLTGKYQVLCLLSLLFLHSPSSFSSSLSSNSQCSALLQFNNSLSLDSYVSSYDRSSSHVQLCETSYPRTASWKEDKHCCSWDGVECDKNTGHVIGLDLSCSRLKGAIDSNSTLFLLRHLRSLNLAGNYFHYSPNSSEFGQFKSLTHLNLSHSFSVDHILSEISQLSSLVSLDLSYNNYMLIETPIWNNLTLLRELHLDYTDMSSIRPKSLMNLSSSLTTLSLHSCNLQGKLENSILLLPSLQTLDLGSNPYLNGSLPKSNWSSTSLKFLDLSKIKISGEIPEFIGNLKALKYLDLSYCKLSGSIPTSLGNFTQITDLILSSNNFTGSIPTSLENLTQLTLLSLSKNKLSGVIPACLGNLTKLTSLQLVSNNFNGLLPSSLLNLPNLSTLLLGDNQLVGPLPNHLVGVVAVEIIVSAWLSIKYPVTCKVDGFDVLEHINNLCALE
ncbi:receptor-like protein 6 isoform X2 [Quercus suber]|uniref:receptor-like protein 6 isoform X2 n=1 Tax=Quercus suber TaxID=58331 RepID=UPI0032DE3105